MAEVRGLISRLGAEGRTILLSSHLLNEVEQVCDSVAILSNGRLIQQGSVQELLEQRGAVRVRTTDDARAADIISGLQWVTDVSNQEESILIGAPPDRSWEITEALAKEGIYVSEMAPLLVSLERYFLEVTGQDTAAGNAQEEN